MIDFYRDFQSINFWHLMLFQILSCYKYCPITYLHALALILFVFFIDFRKTYMFLIKNIWAKITLKCRKWECCHPMPPRWPPVTFWFIFSNIFILCVCMCHMCRYPHYVGVCIFFQRWDSTCLFHIFKSLMHIYLQIVSNR